MQKALRKLALALSSAGLLGGLVLSAGPAAAQGNVLDPACQGQTGAELCVDNAQGGQGAGNNSLFGANGILTRAARLISIVTGIAGVILVSLGGFRYVTSGGDERKVQAARDTIIYAIAGLVIAASSQAIIIFVLNRIGL